MNEPDTLDEQINAIMLENLGDTGWNGSLLSKQYQTAKQQLKALFTEHSKEVDRLARIDELQHIHCCDNKPVAGYGDDSIDVCSGGHEKRIAQLKRNKGEDNE